MTYGPGTPLVALTSQDATYWPDMVRGSIKVCDPINEGALYVCAGVEPVWPGMTCRYCGGAAVGITLHGKQGVFCSTIFRPLNDGQVEETRADPVPLVIENVRSPWHWAQLPNCRCVIVPLEPPA